MCNQLLISSRNMAAESNWEKIWIFQRRLTTRECPPPWQRSNCAGWQPDGSTKKSAQRKFAEKKVLTKVPAGSKIFSPTRITLHQSTMFFLQKWLPSTYFFVCCKKQNCSPFLYKWWPWNKWWLEERGLIKHSLGRYSWERLHGWKHGIDNDALKIRGSHSIALASFMPNLKHHLLRKYDNANNVIVDIVTSL